MLPGVVVADDLTGACDTGHRFADRGYQTRVRLDAAAADDADVLVVNTDTRYAPPETAAATVRAAIANCPAQPVYKKIDSTLRGNLTAEVDAALAAVSGSRGGVRGDTTNPIGYAHAPLGLVAPASPTTGRTTERGQQLIAGTPVTETEVGQDPAAGPASAHLPTLFAESDHPVERIGLETVAAGADAVASHLCAVAAEPRVVVADATNDTHLAALAQGASQIARPIVYVGSQGLAGHVCLPGDDRSTGPRLLETPMETAGVLGVVGSVAQESLAALDAVPDCALVALDPAAAVATPGAVVEQAAERVLETMGREDRAVLTAATDRDAVNRALDAGKDAGLAPPETRARIAAVLAQVTGRVARERQPQGLVLTGGDTAGAVLAALEATSIRLSGEAVEAGAPLGAIEGGLVAGTALITKAGAFGGRETLITCLDRLAQV